LQNELVPLNGRIASDELIVQIHIKVKP